MKRDLKLNMSHLDAISRKVQSYIAVRDFLNNSELQGQAFDNLRMQIEDYLMILRTMRAANCSDISDFNTLSGSVGDVMLQRITVLQEIQEVGVFRAYIYADSPDIKIEEDEESKALTINFKEYRNIGSESAPTFSNLGDSSIKVKYTMDKAGKTGGK